jgi:ectoine hydroxylase-related dioxygenase (phytanoyl-CoA dioxygenase family)
MMPIFDMAKLKEDVDRDGYCIVPEVLSPSELAAVRERVLEQAEAERALGWARMDAGPKHVKRMMEDQAELLREDVAKSSDQGVNQRIGFLVNKGKVFRDLVTHPVALELTEHVLGKDFLLSQFSANIANKGAEIDGLHRDQWWCPMPYQEGESYVKCGDRRRNTSTPDSAPKGVNIPPMSCNFIWMITDFTEETGATRIVPGSHRLPANADSSVPHKIPSMPATGKAGGGVFFDARLWHATGQNHTDEPRIGLLCGYVGPQVRQLDNHFLGIDPAALNEASAKLLDLLGYTTWYNYGSADNLSSRKRLRYREPVIPELGIARR